MSDKSGPAFPFPYPAASDAAIYGMSLRDWFAGQALAGIMAQGIKDGDTLQVAPVAYLYADAMLKERAK